MTKKKVFTVGYSGKKLVDLEALMEEHKAVLVDIRYKPFSWNPDYRKYNLQEHFGGSYLHFKEFGNKHYKSSGMLIADLETGIKMLESITGNVILMCACKDRAQCHRTFIGNILKERGYDVTELDPPQPTQEKLW